MLYICTLMQLYMVLKLSGYPSVKRNNLRVFPATALSERKQILPSPFPSEGSFSIGGDVCLGKAFAVTGSDLCQAKIENENW
jgi:hypothetical protein